MASEGSEVRLREAWLGCGPLYARRTLGNAEAWTAQQNREYAAAFEAQKRDIVAALARESAAAKKVRTDPIRRAPRPDSSDELFDCYWPIKELESRMQFNKGLISGLEQSRECSEALLEAAKREVAELQAQHAKLLLGFRPQFHHHLQRHGVNVFKREVADSDGEDSEARSEDEARSGDKDIASVQAPARKKAKCAPKKAGRADGRVESIDVDFWCWNLKYGLKILVEVNAHVHVRTA